MVMNRLLRLLLTVMPEAKLPWLRWWSKCQHIIPPVRVLLSVSVLTVADECWALVLIPVVFFPSESIYWPSSEVTLTPQQIPQAHRHILNLEPVFNIQVQTGLLPFLQVGYTVVPLADFMQNGQVERAEWSFLPDHLQLQAPSCLLFVQALVTNVHVQHIGPSTADIDPVRPNQLHLIAAPDFTKLQCSSCWDVWRVRDRKWIRKRKVLNKVITNKFKRQETFSYLPAMAIKSMWISLFC